MRLSTLRTSTRPSPASAARAPRSRRARASATLPSAAVEREDVAVLGRDHDRVRASAPTPADSCFSTVTRQRSLPLAAASSRTTVPSRAAANTASPASAGKNTKRSALADARGPQHAHLLRLLEALQLGRLGAARRAAGRERASAAATSAERCASAAERVEPHAHAFAERAVLRRRPFRARACRPLCASAAWFFATSTSPRSAAYCAS